MIVTPLPSGPFSIVMADPPWTFNDRKNCDPRLCGFKYPPMSTAEMCSIPVRDVCTEPAALFLWVTNQHGAEGHHIRVAAAWGFTLVTKAFCWVKTNRRANPDSLKATQAAGGGLRSGCGHWTNSNTEDCWLGFNSRKRPHRLSKSVKQLIFAPVTIHSAKPPGVHARIEQLLGPLPRIELFARGAVPDGWAGWGNEYTGGTE